jgi:hypothetical protein
MHINPSLKIKTVNLSMSQNFGSTHILKKPPIDSYFPVSVMLTKHHAN